MANDGLRVIVPVEVDMKLDWRLGEGKCRRLSSRSEFKIPPSLAKLRHMKNVTKQTSSPSRSPKHRPGNALWTLIAGISCPSSFVYDVALRYTAET